MKGFTLIEILVSVAIFSVAMVIALGALLTMSVADRKAESLKSVINNLNFAMDSMSRSIRVGSTYHCDNSGILTSTQDCVNGANYFAFTDKSGRSVEYRLNSTISPGNPIYPTECQNHVGCIQRQINGTGFTDITSPDVIICDFSSASAASATCPQVSSPSVSYLFYVVGSGPGPSSLGSDLVQPKVFITLSGNVQVSPTQITTLNLQTSVTQRIYDL